MLKVLNVYWSRMSNAFASRMSLLFLERWESGSQRTTFKLWRILLSVFSFFFFNEINSNRSNDWFNVLMEQKNRCIARLIIFKAVSYVSERKNWTWLLNHKHKHKHLCVPVERLHHTRYCSIHFKTLAVYIALSSVAVLFALAARNER